MEWISVNDELPDFNKRVFVYHWPVHPVMEGRIFGITERIDLPKTHYLYHSLDANGFKNTSEVSHWMLPEPPKI